MGKNWWLDELKYAGDEHFDESYVKGYERKAQFDPTEDIQQLLQLGLSRESQIIDFGAGTGSFALAIAPYCASVIAVDPSPAMNAYLREVVVKRRISNLTISNKGFLTYDHRGEPVDFIFTRNALHHLPDFWKIQALSRMHSMLTANGILRIKDLIFDFSPEETDQSITEWIANAVEDPSAGWTADERAEHVQKEFSTYSWIFELMLEKTGFEIVERSYRRRVYGTYTCRRLG